MAFPNTGGGRTVYVYNNIFYGAWSDQVAVQIEPYDIYTDLGGTAYIANNLFIFRTVGIQTRFMSTTDQTVTFKISTVSIIIS
jgi:hypothetical protein